ncbi:uncharacterized protein LOC110684847 isoform X2 [Chenopodium quinoa]|uniref:uncharacterized protein LOC110684847 isoform X2 n=1 Tax=Chenopodium quinoa TaxID=63459 RepID=UPI000B793481|nr:uncharacterized protein LOC110684847 isoform X2 [Chenopodium quinoa]XP_021716972.1 uncharacterized protein LOC110684847 isoform X2 [Chenopodium quinoa]
MPLSVSSKLNMGNLKATNITLQMADRSLKYPLGVLEDVPGRVGKFYIPVDFVVLDMEEDLQIPIILGRPFLHIVGAIIDVKSGKLTLCVGDENIIFNLHDAPKSPMLEEKCYSIDVVDVNNFSIRPQALVRDPLEAVFCVTSSTGKATTWKDEVDAIERALNCVGLRLEDEQVEKKEQLEEKRTQNVVARPTGRKRKSIYEQFRPTGRDGARTGAREKRIFAQNSPDRAREQRSKIELNSPDRARERDSKTGQL